MKATDPASSSAHKCVRMCVCVCVCVCVCLCVCVACEWISRWPGKHIFCGVQFYILWYMYKFRRFQSSLSLLLVYAPRPSTVHMMRSCSWIRRPQTSVSRTLHSNMARPLRAFVTDKLCFPLLGEKSLLWSH